MKRAVFIGRYSPFHKGHFTIMKKKLDEGKPLLILIRNTHYDLYPPELRKRMIEAAMAKINADAKIEIIDDIESINYGRGVGYEVNEIQVDENIKKISATEIRELISRGDNSWKDSIPDGADKVLENYLKQSGIVVWFTGLPKSGKSTIANIVSEELEKRGIKNQRLDSSVMRNTVSKDLGFSKEHRRINLERASHVANFMAKQGGVVLSSFITPSEDMRSMVREIVENENSFVEVFVKASLDTCKSRDSGGLYEKAERGEIKDFTGITDQFEPPNHSHIILDTENKSAKECAKEVVEYIESLVN